MSISKLCPFCDDNVTCRSRLPITAMSRESRASTSGVAELDASVGGYLVTQKDVCRVAGTAFDTAIRTGAEVLVFELEPSCSAPAAEMISAVISCRAILKFHDPDVSANKLTAIHIVGAPEQLEAVNAGLNKQHPLCLGCFENGSK